MARQIEKNASALERGGIYSLLSTVCLKQPTPELVAFYREITPTLEGLPGLDRVKGYLQSTRQASPEDVCRDLAASFTKFFRSTAPPIAPPYESAYKGEQLFGKATDAVLRVYRSHGMELGGEHKGEPPDYLGFELDFMRFLCESEGEAQDTKILEAEKDFLEEHLLTWVERFAEIVRKYDDKGFYAGWCEFAVSWLKQDYRHITDLLS